MNIDLVAHADQFLKEHLKDRRPLLVGLSGGPDSLTLLHILLKIKDIHSLNLQLAHIDHGWRSESAQEAQILQAKAREWGLPFHLRTLSRSDFKGNLEAASREKRYAFFAEVYARENCQALLLGHHAQDQAETVLKRIFEGTSLPLLAGIAEQREMLGMEVWRPLLKIPKSAILAYLEAHALQPFYDPTNNDSRFLRGRMRTNILPWLSDHFGKEIQPALNRIGEEAAELKQFMDQHLTDYLSKIVVSPYGSFLDLSLASPESLYELKYLLRKLGETQSISLPRTLIDTLIGLITEKVADRCITCKDVQVEVDRGRIFLYTQPFPSIEAVFQEVKTEDQTTSWREAWRGEGHVFLPEGEYRLGPPKLDARCMTGSTLGKWWTDHKVPAFLRHNLPVVYLNDRVAHEFLTGRLQRPNIAPTVSIKLSSLPMPESILSIPVNIAHPSA